MKHESSSCARSIAILLALIAALFAFASSQDAPSPLTDEEFTAAIESDDTTQWLKIQVMTDDQAKLLGKKHGIEVIMGFASDPVHCYYLNNLRSLNAEQAKALSKTKASLCLNGLKDLSAEAAKELVRYSGEYVWQLWFNQSLKREQELVWIGGIVALNGLDSLSDDAAKSLGKIRAYELQLNGIKTLSKAQAKNLAKSETNIMQLASLRSLSEDIAKDLSMYGGKYFMPSLTKESRDILVKYGGEMAGR